MEEQRAYAKRLTGFEKSTLRGQEENPIFYRFCWELDRSRVN